MTIDMSQFFQVFFFTPSQRAATDGRAPARIAIVRSAMNLASGSDGSGRRGTTRGVSVGSRGTGRLVARQLAA